MIPILLLACDYCGWRKNVREQKQKGLSGVGVLSRWLNFVSSKRMLQLWFLALKTVRPAMMLYITWTWNLGCCFTDTIVCLVGKCVCYSFVLIDPPLASIECLLCILLSFHKRDFTATHAHCLLYMFYTACFIFSFTPPCFYRPRHTCRQSRNSLSYKVARCKRPQDKTIVQNILVNLDL